MGEKSVMVCRHWKSKGWCKLEAQCKFLHPEHKRGAGTLGNDGVGGAKGGEGQMPAAISPSSAPGGMEVTSSKSRSSRRSGRGRQGGQSGGGGGVVNPPPAVAVGLLPVDGLR